MGKRTSPEKKEQAISLLLAGVPIDEIAEKLKIGKNALGGLISSLKKSGRMSADAYPAKNFIDPSHPAAQKKRGPGRPRKDAGQATSSPFPWKGAVGDFSGSEVMIEVERISPADGYLGKHPEPFSKEDLARIYGGTSTYELTRIASGQPPQKCRIPVSEVFGPPKSPRSTPPRSPHDRNRQDPRARERERWYPGAPTPWAPYENPDASLASKMFDVVVKKFDDREDEKIASLVKIYETMKPKDAARIFNELDLEILIEVLRRMREAKAALIIAKMNSEQAKIVTMELAVRNSLPDVAAATVATDDN